jgi:hypothetical protein
MCDVEIAIAKPRLPVWNDDEERVRVDKGYSGKLRLARDATPMHGQLTNS